MSNQQVVIDNLKDFIVCPLCGKSFKSLTSTHLKSRHDMSTFQFREMFPDFTFYSKEVSNKRSNSIKEAWKDDTKRENIMNSLRSEEAKKKMSESSKRCWNDKTLRESRVKKMREVASTEEHRKRCSENSKRTWKNPEFRKHRVDGIRRATSTEEYKEGQSKHSKEMWKNPDHPRKVIEGYRNSNRQFPFYFKDGTVLKTRSSYEVIVCGYLESLDIDFEYEKYRFDYYLKEDYQGYTKGFHSYYPDFYLPNEDIFLEVKPKGLDTFLINELKINSVREDGKKIHYVTEDEIESIESFKEFIESVKTSTTIP